MLVEMSKTPGLCTTFLGGQLAAFAPVPSHVSSPQFLGRVECILTTSNLLGEAVRVTVVLASRDFQTVSFHRLFCSKMVPSRAEGVQLVLSHPRELVVLNVEEQQRPVSLCVTSCRAINRGVRLAMPILDP
jgi:hypothetical protein